MEGKNTSNNQEKSPPRLLHVFSDLRAVIGLAITIIVSVASVVLFIVTPVSDLRAEFREYKATRQGDIDLIKERVETIKNNDLKHVEAELIDLNAQIDAMDEDIQEIHDIVLQIGIEQGIKLTP